MRARFNNSRFARLVAARRYVQRLAGALAVLAMLAAAGARLALGQTKTTGRMLPSKPVTVLKTDAATPAAPQQLAVRPLVDTGSGLQVQYQYFLGTSPVNGSTVQQEVVTFITSSSDNPSFVPTVGLRYGINYSVGPVSCTDSTQSTYSGTFNPYVQTCTVTVTFAPLYPGGHRDALFAYDTDGKTVLTGAFLYGIGVAPQLMIQPGVTTNLHLTGYPYLYGSTVDEAGTYYVYSNNNFYTVTKQGVASVYATSVPEGDMLSIDGAGNLFSNASNNSSGYELQAPNPSLCYTGPGDKANNPVIIAETVCFDSPNAVAVGNLGTYYDADRGGESTYIGGQYVQFSQGFLAQPYGSITSYPLATFIPTYVTNSPLLGVKSPVPVPTSDPNLTNAGGIEPIAYPLDSGNYSPYAMVVDPYENVFFADHNYGIAVWCGQGDLFGISSALSGSSNGCGSWGTSMVALNNQYNSLNVNMAVDAADTLYAGQTNLLMFSASNNYATPITSFGVSGFAGGVSLAPDGTLYVQGGINTINIIDRSQGSIDFGSNNGQTSNPYTMTLYNGGNQPLTISSIAASGAGYSVQPYTTNPCSTSGNTVVAVGTICQFQVQFTSPHNGISTGAITITSNSLNNASAVQTVALSAELSGIYVTALPTPVNFGYVAPGSNATLPVTVTNYSVGSNSVGYGGTVFINGALSSSNPAYTVSPGTCSAPLASGASCQLQVTFNSGTTTTYPGTISWTEQISGGPSQQVSVAVTGTGVMPVTLTPISLAFGTVDVGSSSAPQTLTLTNPTGNGPLTIGSITAVAGYVFTSTGSNPCSTSLADGASCTLGVIFSPVGVGSDNGTLAVKDSAGNSPQTVALTGNGIFSPDFETIHITDLLSLVPSTLLPDVETIHITDLLSLVPSTLLPDVETIHVTDQLSLVSSTVMSFNEVIHVSDDVQRSMASGGQTTPTVTWPPASAITYGTALSAVQLNATASVAGTFAYSPAAGTVLGAGAQVLTATFTPASTSTYATVTASMPLTVLPAPLTVTIGNASCAFATVGSAACAVTTTNPAFTYSVTGYVNGEGSGVISGAPALSTTATLSSPAGAYPINGAVGTLAAANYSFNFVPGTLTIQGSATQTITFLPISNVPLAIGHLTLTAHSSSNGLGAPIVYSVTGPASISGSTLTLTGTGLVTVTATQAGNATFAPAKALPQTFTVTP